MVNKCSVTNCKSLYMKNKNNVKLHRFPLSNAETLPLWIAATGREKDWKPSKSSRICGNHFQPNEYVIGHGKGVLKTTSVPTIEYRTDTVMKFTRKRTSRGASCDEDQLKDSDPNVEIVQLGYNDMYNFKYGHQSMDTNYDHGESSHENESEKIEYNENNKPLYLPILNNNDDEHNSSYGKVLKIEDFSHEINNDICNRENQCYMFTSSFKETIILAPPEVKPSEELLTKNVNHSTVTSNNSLNKIRALKLKKHRCTKDIYSLYFKSLKKNNIQKQEKNKNYSNGETASFAAFIEAQMKEIRPYRKTYLTTKHKIQKILMKAQLKIANTV